MKIQFVVQTKDFGEIKSDMQSVTDEQFKEIDDFVKELCTRGSYMKVGDFYIPGEYLRNSCIIRLEKIENE